MDRKNEVKRFDTLILSILLFTALAMVFTACGTQKGGCGGNPIHLGN